MNNLFSFNNKTLTYEKIKSKSYIKIGTYIVGGFIFLFILGWLSGTNNYIIKRFNKTEIVESNKTPFSEENLIKMFKDCNIKYPYIVLAQAKLESGNFTSKLFRENNNMFGMRKARQRITTAQTEKGNYAYYRDWLDCVYDYAMYQSSVMCTVNNETEYFSKLGERYAEDSTYVSKLKNIIKKEKLKSIFED